MTDDNLGASRAPAPGLRSGLTRLRLGSPGFPANLHRVWLLVNAQPLDHAESVEFDRGTITAELAAATCKSCGNIGAKMEFVFDQGPHFARVDCRRCGTFIDWVRFPDAPVKSNRRKSRKKLRDLGNRCEICLRHRDELPNQEKLEVHHVLEVAADDGTDDPANLRAYCSACHAMVSWTRIYFGHYHVPAAPPSVDAKS